MKNKITKILTLTGLLIVVAAIVIVFAVLDFGAIWNQWGIQEDGKMVYPDYRYIFLIFYKLIIYLFVPLTYSMVLTVLDKRNIKRKYIAHLLKILNLWFLILLTLKLVFNTILETDRVFGIEFFSSLNEIETLVGFVLTLLLRQNVKIEPKLSEKSENKQNDFITNYNVSKSYILDKNNSKLNAETLETRINLDFPEKPVNENFNILYVYYYKNKTFSYPLGDSNVLYIGSTKGEINNKKKNLGFRFKHCFDGQDSKQNISLSKIYQSNDIIAIDIIEISESENAKDVEGKLHISFLDKYGAYPISAGASYSSKK